MGTNYTKEFDIDFESLNPFSGSEVLFLDGDLLGLSLNAGFLSLNKNSFSVLVLSDGGDVRGSVQYTLLQPSPNSPPASVPEPSAIFGLLMFSAMGYSRTLKAKKK